MEKKIFVVLAIFLISLFPSTSAQLSLGEPAQHKLITINIGDDGEMHVIHEIRKSLKPVQIDTIEGIVSNLKVTDVKGNNVEYGTTGTETITGVTVFSSPNDVLIEYDLDDALFLKDGIWTWDYFNLETTKIIFPEYVDLLFVNNNPVLLQDAKGITCYGRSQGAICDAHIEYIINEPTTTEKIQWEDNTFDVKIRTLTEISSFNFDQPTKTISFDVNEDDQLITLIIPLKLLWYPYQVYLDDQKILKHRFFSNETHAWLNIRPESSGTVQIIGTTAVPEFPMLVPLFLGITIVVVLQFRNRINLR